MGVLPIEQYKTSIMTEATLFCYVFHFFLTLWFPPLVGDWLGQISYVSPKCQVSFCCLRVWVVTGRCNGGMGRKGRQQWLFVSLVLHSSFPKQGMSSLLRLKSMRLNPFFGGWDPSLGNKWPASAFAVFSRKGGVSRRWVRHLVLLLNTGWTLASANCCGEKNCSEVFFLMTLSP